MNFSVIYKELTVKKVIVVLVMLLCGFVYGEEFYYFGVAENISVDGKVKSGVSLAKRVFNKTNNFVEETYLNISALNNNVSKKIFKFKYFVTSDRGEVPFEMIVHEGNMNGLGILYGEMWKWRRWDYQVQVQSSTENNKFISIIGAYHIDSQGLVNTATNYDENGEVLSHAFSRLNTISKDSYENLWDTFSLIP